MADYRPLFPKETKRTRQFRRVIIRKTLQLVRKYPDLKDEQIMALAEKEAVQICDLCVESSMEEAPSSSVGQYFLNADESQRRDHVGRLFLHKLEGNLRQGSLKECLIPVFCQSVVNLLGQEVYDSFSDRIDKLISYMTKQGVVYNDMLDSKPARILMAEIIEQYKIEKNKTGSFADQLKNKIDTALVEYQREHPNEQFDIEQGVEDAYNDFIKHMELD